VGDGRIHVLEVYEPSAIGKYREPFVEVIAGVSHMAGIEAKANEIWIREPKESGGLKDCLHRGATVRMKNRRDSGFAQDYACDLVEATCDRLKFGVAQGMRSLDAAGDAATNRMQIGIQREYEVRPVCDALGRAGSEQTRCAKGDFGGRRKIGRVCQLNGRERADHRQSACLQGGLKNRGVFGHEPPITQFCSGVPGRGNLLKDV
jgi:hypothetical protein